MLAQDRSGSASVISFAYEDSWAGASDAFQLDPSLPLFSGEQYPPRLPGIFMDSAPDRWGRTLLERREAILARREERSPRTLADWDFLLGVDDETRMGALRLVDADRDHFLDSRPLPVPPYTRLRELEALARAHEAGQTLSVTEEDRWIGMLVDPGSSLGGARPKASFRDEDGALWIAKFPSRDDRRDVAAWEFVLSRIARRAGITVPKTRLMRLGGSHSTFCSRRFDRTRDGRRLYASAMTLVGRGDNEPGGYLDIVQAIETYGAPTTMELELEQLFRRLVFNVMVANRDDHLRNHGFLRRPEGWRLAPAFDVNPSPEKRDHSLALDGDLRIPDLDLVRETSPFYRLTPAQANEIIAEVEEAVRGWRIEADEACIPGVEVELMAPSFRAGARRLP